MRSSIRLILRVTVLWGVSCIIINTGGCLHRWLSYTKACPENIFPFLLDSPPNCLELCINKIITMAYTQFYAPEEHFLMQTKDGMIWILSLREMSIIANSRNQSETNKSAIDQRIFCILLLHYLGDTYVGESYGEGAFISAEDLYEPSLFKWN